MNIGEEICGEWLRQVAECDFVEYNRQIRIEVEGKTKTKRGEIDVIGVKLPRKGSTKEEKIAVYICEVATHLVTGLRYTSRSLPPDADNSANKYRITNNNYSKLMEKFEHNIKYTQRAFPDEIYQHNFMFWSPVVKRDGEQDISSVIKDIKDKYKVELVPMINKSFLGAITKLRNIARSKTSAMESSAMRMLQVEEYLMKEHYPWFKDLMEQIGKDCPLPSEAK